MPIFMDRHDVSESVTAENVAQLHQEDLKIQHKFNSRGLTYWFDDKRKTAFCLIEAPDEKTIVEMHNHAHGEVPHRIIEVDPNVVESFLGRIEDPKNFKNSDLNIINDPAFRTIVVIQSEWHSLRREIDLYPNSLLQSFRDSVNEIVKNCNGKTVKQSDDYFLLSFESVSDAVLCSVEVQTEIEKLKIKNQHPNIYLNIGISAGLPVTQKDTIFEDTIKLAERICHVANAKIMISSEVETMYKSENLNQFINKGRIVTLTPSDERFITNLLAYTELTWNDASLKIDNFNKHLGYSKSQFYRKMIEVTGKSPISFLKEFRLNRALNLLRKNTNNISEVAFDSGFSSPSYFSKCFQKRYGSLPSEFLYAINE